MAFLRFLEGLRFPALDAFFSAITYLGDELAFMAVAVLLFWCIDKRRGYYLFVVGFFGIVSNQFLKLLFRVPRPWVLEPDFTIVESARASAGGYSFPSGHTQSAVGTFGVIGITANRRWVRTACLAIILLIPFSRMYLGVHTPLDVGVSALIAAVLVLALKPVFRAEESMRKAMPWILGAVLICSAAYALFVLRTAFPADVDTENLNSGIKSGYMLLGASVSMIVVYVVDTYRLHFDVRAPLPGQILKLVLGLGLLVGIKTVLKQPLYALFGGSYAADAVRYGIVILFAGCVWPLTFPLFARLGRKEYQK